MNKRIIIEMDGKRWEVSDENLNLLLYDGDMPMVSISDDKSRIRFRLKRVEEAKPSSGNPNTVGESLSDACCSELWIENAKLKEENDKMRKALNPILEEETSFM